LFPILYFPISKKDLVMNGESEEGVVCKVPFLNFFVDCPLVPEEEEVDDVGESLLFS
jgi:hypothetical protein